MKNKLEELFVPHVESYDLKELGFDEACFRGWDIDGELRYHPDSDIDVDNPLFSQAFQFFRDKYKFHHSIEFDGVNYNGYVIGLTANIFKTYEECELACLRQLILRVNEK